MHTHMLVVLQEDRPMNARLHSWTQAPVPNCLAGTLLDIPIQSPRSAPFTPVPSASSATSTPTDLHLPGTTSTATALHLPGLTNATTSTPFPGTTDATINIRFPSLTSREINVPFPRSTGAATNTWLPGMTGRTANVRLPGTTSKSASTQLPGAANTADYPFAALDRYGDTRSLPGTFRNRRSMI